MGLSATASFTRESWPEDNLSSLQRDIDEPVCAGGAIGCRQQGGRSMAHEDDIWPARVFLFGVEG